MSPLFYIQPLFVPLNKCWQKFTPKILSFIFHPSKRPTQHESRIYIIILSFRKGYYLRYKSCAVSLIAQQYQPTALLCQSDLIAYLGRTELSPLLGFPMQAGWPASCQESWLRWPLSYFSEKPHWRAWNRAFCTAAKIPRWSTPEVYGALMSKKQTLYPTPSSLPWIIQSFPVSCPQKSYMQRGTTAEQPTVSLLIVANTVMSHFPSLSDSFLSFLTLAAWSLHLSNKALAH